MPKKGSNMEWNGMERKFNIALQLHEQQVTRVCTEALTTDVKK